MKQDIDIGSAPNDGTGDTLRAAGAKINANFDELYGVTGQQAMIPIMAGGMTARTSDGAASGSVETATNKVMIGSLDFDDTTDEFAQFMLPMPESWDEGAIYAEFISTGGATGNVAWNIQGACIGDGDALDTAFGAAAVVIDGVSDGNLSISAKSGPIVLGGSAYAAGDLCVFQISRDPDNGSDTLAGDASLIGVRLYITLDDYEDS